jgi:hypothetical protein
MQTASGFIHPFAKGQIDFFQFRKEPGKLLLW